MLVLLGGCNRGNSEAEQQRRVITQKIELVEAEGGYVLMVGGETLTSDQIIDSRIQINQLFISPKEYFRPLAQTSDFEQFKERAKEPLEEIIIDNISNILFYQHAKRQAGGNIDEGLEKMAENEYRKFVLGFGGNQARADEELKQNQMDKKSFIEQRKRALLIEWYKASKLSNNQPVTYRELMDCYSRIKDKYFARAAKIRFRLIDIHPDRLEVTDPNEDRRQLGIILANKLLALIKSGRDFGELAKQYSHGNWREFGGLWRSIQPSSLAEPYDVLARRAEQMQVGDVAGPIVTEQHIFIMKLEEKQIAGYELFEDVQELVKEKVLLDRRSEVIDKLNEDIRRQAELGSTDKFTDFCLEKIYVLSNAAGES
jgi:hypothetical protein